ncbi:hypothetical protein CE91St59_14580 [[Clostridium] scindens]|nr:hypothetical protein CE91St59_14580 [[Clostridium] scindens]BDF19892.1 hypothetical protein CE91St60_14750 [[Clostridium] scindens]
MGKTTTEMQLVQLGKLVPYINNARTHSSEQLTKLRSSLREFYDTYDSSVVVHNCSSFTL